jgi:hypothetical protein
MENNLEKLIGLIYRRWQKDNAVGELSHPDEEDFALFLEDKLSPEEGIKLKTHILSCTRCSELLAFGIKAKKFPELEPPKELVARAQGLVDNQGRVSILEVILSFKDNIIELLNTTGDCLVGQEFVPAPVLRSRKIKDFKDEVTIVKDFQDVRVEARIQNKGARVFDLTILACLRQSQEKVKDLRVTLFKDEVELESYLTDSGSVKFEHVSLGEYKVELSSLGENVASVLVEIRA